MQYETCRHLKEDVTYCGSPSLRERKYCYYHLMQRRLRRARALRDNLPYRLEIQSLDYLYAVRAALTDIAQALAAGQLDARTRRQASLRHPAGLGHQPPHRADGSRTIERWERRARPDPRRQLPHPGISRIRRKFDLRSGADLDAETDAVLRKADDEAELRQATDPMPLPPPGVRVGSPAYRVYREEAYQMLRLQVKELRHDLRDYHEQKREKLKKEVMSSFPAPERRADSA